MRPVAIYAGGGLGCWWVLPAGAWLLKYIITLIFKLESAQSLVAFLCVLVLSVANIERTLAHAPSFALPSPICPTTY
jgi:hypothetical protein